MTGNLNDKVRQALGRADHLFEGEGPTPTTTGSTLLPTLPSYLPALFPSHYHFYITPDI